MKRLLATAAAFSLAFSALLPVDAGAADRSLSGEGLTAVVPEVQEFTPSAGAAFFVSPTTRIIATHGSLVDEAELLVDELVALDLAHGLGLNVEPTVVTLSNDGAAAAPVDVRADLAELAAVADVQGLTTTLLDDAGAVVEAPGTNLALGATVRASGQEVPDRWGPALAVDGDVSTRYSSNESDSAWIAVQLPEPTVVDHVTIRWELAAARYKLQTSTDGVTWTDATAELRATVQSISRETLTTTEPVKFVRMQAIERTPAVNGLKYGVSMFEFEVWDGPEQGMEVPQGAIVDGVLTWDGSLPAGHTLVLDWESVIRGTAKAGTPFAVEATVDAPFFPAVVSDTVNGRVTPDTPTSSPSPTPTKPTTPATPPTSPAKPKFERTAPYTLPGVHKGLNGRDWNTTCEPYSQTERCRTDIWATVVVIEGGQFVRKSGWTFNNLTYLPYMTREAWGTNPLGSTNEWTATTDGRKWRTECDTARTGRNGCRSYTYVTVYSATAKATGGYAFSQRNEWVFNNIVMFGGPELR
ncbi:hypothetical protein GCM10025789_09390 [Tessaracoccus lubricantis]|uniref:F5/8 type C domain-containing protein n=1 Tax=Tessaracoccus lubricantis TaxID=545543 RepID=A0ABP9F5Z2_9ACTN